MSYREIRNFTEHMRALGYPRLISMENFRTPNFELVADCLAFLIHRYDPNAYVSEEISTESDRTEFLQTIGKIMYTKARMKLNIKRLYAADGTAVRELLKIAEMLYKSVSSVDEEPEGETIDTDMSVLMKDLDLKNIRQLATDIVKAGAAVHEELGKEPELREYRQRAVQRNMDSELIEQAVRDAINSVNEGIAEKEGEVEELEREEKRLDSKIEKKKKELGRGEQRLAGLQKVRPAYMDELERLEVELQAQYATYLERFRNLEYLEFELDSYHREEQERMVRAERKLKKMQKRLADEEYAILRGETQINEGNLNLDDRSLDSDTDDDDIGLGDRPGGGAGPRIERRDGRGGMGGGPMGGPQGSMLGGMGDSASDEELDDSDSDGRLSHGGDDVGGLGGTGRRGGMGPPGGGYGGYDSMAMGMGPGADDDFVGDDGGSSMGSEDDNF